LQNWGWPPKQWQEMSRKEKGLVIASIQMAEKASRDAEKEAKREAKRRQ
jgi:hypothetical protein